MARLTLQLLGGFAVRLGSGRAATLGTKKAQALIAYLAVPPGRAHPRDKLAGLLWGDTGDEQARQSVRQTLVALRRALPDTRPPILVVDRDTLALDPAAVDVDVSAFEHLAGGSTAKALEQAMALYQGDLLEGVRVTEEAFEDWLRAERGRLRQLAVDALTRLLALESKANETERAIRTAARLLALDPVQETVHRALMRLYARQGRRAEALRQYQVCVSVLQREVATEPEAETKHLYRELLQQAARGPVPEASAPRSRRTPTRIAPPEAPALEGQFIGREAEMARMRRAWAAAAHGQGQVVVIVGEAGIGKSRLLAEVVAEAVQQDGRVVLGHCYESEQILPFGPWVDAFRTGGVIGDEAALGQLNPASRAELGKLVPEIAGSGGPAPTGDRLLLFESVVHVVEQLAAARPTVLALEDLHWSDELSRRLLAFVARRIRTVAVLIIATVREDEPGSAEALHIARDELEREAHCASLTLAPLSRAETTALVEALAQKAEDGGRAAARVEHVWAISEGNPFVAVETMRAFQEGAMSAVPAPDWPLPPRIREVIGRRLDRLSPQAQELATVAAVIGREFEFALLHRAGGIAERETALGVEELVRRRVLHGIGERFDFTHDRIREAIVAGLLAPRKKVLHGQVAGALEDLYASRLEQHTTALGLHHLHAEAWDKASRYLFEAGKAARWRIAFREAVACLNFTLQALDRLPPSRIRDERAADVRLELGKAHTAYASPLSDRALALGHLREAERLAVELHDQRRLGKVSTSLAGELLLLGEYGPAVKAGQRALDIGSDLRDIEIQVGARSPLGRAHHALGNFGQARSLYEENLLELSDLDTRNSLRLRFAYAVSSGRLACTLAELGEFAPGLARAAEAADICRAIGRQDGLALALFSMGLLHLRRGDVQAAIPVLEEGLAVCRVRENFPIQILPTQAHLGYAYALAGRLPEGLRLLEQSVQDCERLVMVWNQSLWSGWWAEALLLAGRAEDAAALGRRALDLALQHKEQSQEAYARRLLGDIASRDGTQGATEAAREYRLAMSLAEDMGMRPLVAHCHFGLVKLHWDLGRRPEARKHLAGAAAMYREMDMRFWLGQVAALVAD